MPKLKILWCSLYKYHVYCFVSGCFSFCFQLYANVLCTEKLNYILFLYWNPVFEKKGQTWRVIGVIGLEHISNLNKIVICSTCMLLDQDLCLVIAIHNVPVQGWEQIKEVKLASRRHLAQKSSITCNGQDQLGPALAVTSSSHWLQQGRADFQAAKPTRRLLNHAAQYHLWQ
jgi:hypothetical protein